MSLKGPMSPIQHRTEMGPHQPRFGLVSCERLCSRSVGSRDACCRSADMWRPEPDVDPRTLRTDPGDYAPVGKTMVLCITFICKGHIYFSIYNY